jgi:membrane protease YdiL (CAAX protease family)
MFTTLIAVLFTLVLVAGVPALSYSTSRNSEIRKMPRLGLYLSAVFSQWLLTVVGLGVVYLIARKVFVQGFAAMPLNSILEWGAGIAVPALLALSLVILCERRGWLPCESDLVYLLIPETAREKFWAVLIISPTAAFCEEFLFRGYLLTQLHDWLHSLLWAWVVSSVAFGLAHFYQGWSGMIRAGLLGALLAYPVVRWGSLYPAMLAHWMIDTAALLWLGPWMLGKGTATEGRMLE